MTMPFASLTRTALAALVLCGFALSPGNRRPPNRSRSWTLTCTRRSRTLYRSNLVAKDLAGKAAGMLVFPTIIKAGFWVGAEYGEGALLAGQSIVAYYNIVAASFGLQVGVQDESLAILFMTSEALNKFRASKGLERSGLTARWRSLRWALAA